MNDRILKDGTLLISKQRNKGFPPAMYLILSQINSTTYRYYSLSLNITGSAYISPSLIDNYEVFEP